MGYAALLLVTAAVLWVLVLGDQPLTPVVRIKVRFERVGQLEPGSPVKIGNMEVGRVTSIRFAPAKRVEQDSRVPEPDDDIRDNKEFGDVEVSIWVRYRHRKFVRTNSRFYVSSASLIGARHLEIAFPEDEPGRAVRDGDTLFGEPPALMDRMLMMVYDNLKKATEIMEFIGPDLSAVRAGFESLEEMIDVYEEDWVLLKELADQSKKLWKDFGELKDSVEFGTGKGKLIKRPVDKLKKLAENMTQRIRGLEEKGSHLSGLFDQRRDEFASLGLKKQFSETEENFRKVFSVLRGVRDDLDIIVDAVTEGKGTIGALARDRELHHDFQQSQKNILHTPWRVLGRPEKMSVDGLPGP